MRANTKRIFIAVILALITFICSCTAVLFYASAKTGKSVAERFTGDEKLFSVKKADSSVVYGTYNTEDHNRDNKDITGTVSGAVVKLSSGDELFYNKVINLSDKTKTDSIVKLVMTPSVIGVQDAKSITIILTDAYDVENYVEISILDSGESWGAAYAKAAANCGQLLSGWDHSNNRIMRGSNPYGFPIYFSFGANPDNRSSIDEIGKNYINFAMDYENRELHHIGNINTKYSSMIADLDNEEDYGEVWGGFTTGECFLSIKCGGYINQTANFVIPSVMGEPVEDVEDFERTSPNVNVDFKDYSESALPNGEKNKRYGLFDIKYYSPYFSALTAVQNVFYDYGGVKENVTVSDGAFIPTKSGVYTVEITVTDPLNNKTVKTYNVTVCDSIPNIAVIPTSEPITEATAGTKIALPDVIVSGGSGNLDVTYSVRFGHIQMEISDKKIFPTEAGTYTVNITATDYLGNNGQYDYDIEVATAVGPVFTGEVNMPKYLISDVTSQLPVVYAKDYTYGVGKDVPTEITYIDNYGTRTAINGEITPFVRNSGDTVKVIYTAVVNGVSDTLEYDVPTIRVRDNGKISVERLFVADTQTATAYMTENNYVEFRFFDNATYDFINPTVANGIDIRFSANSIGLNYQKVVITLTDTVDTNQTLKLNYNVSGVTTKFSLNDDSTLYNMTKTLGNDFDIIAFTFDNLGFNLRYDTGSTKKIAVKEYANGETFKGFTSGLVYVSFGFYGVDGTSAFRINNIAGKIFNDNDEDFVRPKISMIGDYGGNKAVNSKITLPIIVGVDVVDGKVPVRMTVKAPDGTIMSDNDGQLLKEVDTKTNYVITLQDYGRYIVYVSATDADGNENTYSFEYRVEYDGSPEFTVENVPTSGKTGEKIVLPQAAVKENALVGEITVKTYLLTDTGNFFYLAERAFVPQRAGIYTIRYYCTDSFGNTDLKDFEIKVD